MLLSSSFSFKYPDDFLVPFDIIVFWFYLLSSFYILSLHIVAGNLVIVTGPNSVADELIIDGEGKKGISVES